MGKLRQMYMDTYVDTKKVEESAYKVANDRYDPSPVNIHYHKYSQSCNGQDHKLVEVSDG